MGSSIIRRAFCQARATFDTSNLDMGRFSYSVLWHAKGGLKWRDLLKHINLLLPVVDPPDILVIHCGGNDVAQGNSCVLRHSMISVIDKLFVMFPNSRLVWSAILPRIKWRGEKSHSAVSRIPVRINSQIGAYVVKRGGCYIRYPEITDTNLNLFADDVHLSAVGNQFFLYRLQQALQTFVTSDEQVSPPFGELGPWAFLQ